MKHTPAPWGISGNHVDSGNIQIGSQKDYVAEIYPTPNDEVGKIPNLEESLANAKLIAAAPELLEACRSAKRLLEDLEAAEVIISRDGKVYSEIVEAIKKATGEK